MNCPACLTAVPPPSDPTARHVACPACRTVVDLAATGAGGTTVKTVVRLAPPSDPLVGTDFAGGRYHVESLLGIGGMGRVYTATQRGLARKVALKVLSPEFAKDEQFRRRFDREAGTLASLEHPNIVTVHDVGVEGDTPYIVMSLVKGPKGEPMSLRNLLDGGAMDEEWALRIVQQTCAALEYAHGRGVIHRDIKPGNILIDAQGNAKIADFGIARVAGVGEASQLTSTGAVLGTVRYMAPEQMVDAAHVDARSDLYSLGVVLYEMLTGEAPIGRFELPSETKKGLDHRLDGIVDKALRRAAAQRYQSASEMARDLSRITTEREYGRMVGADTAKAARDAPAALAAPAKAGAAASGPIASDGAPAAGFLTPSAASATSVARPARERPQWLVSAILAGVAVSVVGAVLLFRGGPSSPSVQVVGSTPPVPGSPSAPVGAGKPPLPMPDAPVIPAKPTTKPPEPTDDDVVAADEAGLSADDRAEIADAKKAILQLIANGSRISAEDLETEDTSLPEVKNTDLPGAKAAVERSLAFWKAGKSDEVAGRIPDALLASIGTSISTPAASVKMILETTAYLPTGFASVVTGKAVAMGSEWALVKYTITRSNGASEGAVAVCVREGGVWKVFL